MFLPKFKRFIFNSLGTSLMIGTLWLSIYLGFKFGFAATISWKITLSIILSVLILAILLFLLICMESWVTGSKSKTNSLIISFIGMFAQRNNKWVYHDELGYFFVSFEEGDVYVHDQGFFISKELFTVGNSGNVQQVANSIKKELDSIYSNKVKKEKSTKEIKEKIDIMKKWDGYLDIKGRRDGKIKEILK